MTFRPPTGLDAVKANPPELLQEGLFPTDGDAEESMKRTRALLKSLVGKV